MRRNVFLEHPTAMHDARPPEVGQVSPDVSALDTTGVRCTLTALCADKPLVLVFYRGHW